MLRQEREGDGGEDAEEGREVVPAQRFAEIIHGEDGRQRDGLLDDREPAALVQAAYRRTGRPRDARCFFTSPTVNSP